MPDFASHDYWDTRFTKDRTPFDWLIPATALRDVATDVVDDADALHNAQVLHIGCGTSDASILRDMVENPAQVHNIDFSSAAIEAASERETNILSKSKAPDVTNVSQDQEQWVQSKLTNMRWSCMDLLSLDSTLDLLQRQEEEAGRLFDLVLDKSTSDSISCGANRLIYLPYPLSPNGWTRRILQGGAHHSAEVHPLHVLAVHLAALTTPKSGRWVVISYSEDRFPFLPPLPHSASTGLLDDSTIQAGFTHPNQLWTLETKEKIDLDANRDETLAQRRKRLSAGVVHRPKITHWLYVLRRTEALVTD
ncbi:unnamed protein product [Zymoseptoria tritici ST99CH_1A5]|uniref:Methyltransferase domain-containing protein n=2 Tax=Zymoseptoria tritici TaxID=1047171 RepID=F9XLN2_ZYMTI|nr:uncharacterized protein MYCGRDRAFT_111001 [Zymoseptoria tritici IPO323]EGP84137.1 hypothetical protein MYCGRDRAFT_111001 [Zymoseptoria tritici IPO323]SMR62892.1 unnamed protein product [Zymoseptoria tritici ST99CH_3D1]SMY28263.1 unnamed protein product [Zymoseptoria tritici ST99CH_1A5]